MSPRPYRLGQRLAATEQTRDRVLAAARELLTTSAGIGGFSVDSVARQAGVARMTIYYQFGSKRGLLEALFNDLAARGGMGQLPTAFAQPDPLDALAAYITTFGRVWASDRLVLRRLRALAALDADLEQAIHERDAWGRAGARVILQQLAERYGRPEPDSLDEAEAVVYTLASFETFDKLAGATRSPADVAPLVLRLARAALGLEDSSD
jgi:AcrR family transcriptional regulator